MEVYVVCVWLVNFLINNFYILIGYLWYVKVGYRHIVITESVGQLPNKRIYYLLVVTNVLQVALIIAKYMVWWLVDEGTADYLDENYSQIVFTTLSISVLLYATFQFVKHLKFMHLIYSRRKLFFKIGLMVVGAFAHIAYNIYYILAVSVLKNQKGWMINVDENCQRVSKW